MAPNIPAPQQWWKPWQWILAFVIAPILTILFTQILGRFVAENVQQGTWGSQKDSESPLTPSKDAECYFKNLGNIPPIATPKGFKVSSMTCPSGNTFIRIQTPDEKEKVQWITIEKLFPTYVISNNSYLFNQAIAQSANKEYLPYLITQNQHNIIICSKIINNIMTYVIKKPDGKCFKEKLNIKTGIVIESSEVSCKSASCD
jgi:hypothetical protein